MAELKPFPSVQELIATGRKLRILSLGAGVQSAPLLLMSVRGDLDPLDAAIFADTVWEPAAVYAHLGLLACEGQRHASMPLYTLSPEGSIGMIKRQCIKEPRARIMPEERLEPELLTGASELVLCAPLYPCVAENVPRPSSNSGKTPRSICLRVLTGSGRSGVVRPSFAPTPISLNVVGS